MHPDCLFQKERGQRGCEALRSTVGSPGLIIEVKRAARAVIVIVNGWDIESLLTIPAVEILLPPVAEDPETILKSTKVGTDRCRMNVGRVVGIHLPFTTLHAVVRHQKKATGLFAVLQDAKMALTPVVLTMLEVDSPSLRDLLDVKAQTVIDKQLSTGCFHGLLHPRNGHEVLLGHVGPTLLPSIADGESLSRILADRVLGRHLGAVIGAILVGKGTRHLGRNGINV